MNKPEKRERLFRALERSGGFAALSARIDCAVANLVVYAAGLVEVPSGVLTALRRVLDS